MNSFYEHKDEIVKSLKILWDYMRLQQPLEKCDLIIGCGCSNLDIPVKCSQLFKDGYGSKRIDLCISIPFVKGIADCSDDVDFKNDLSEYLELIQYDERQVYDELRESCARLF